MILWVERKKIKKMASLVTVWGKHCKTHGDERLTSKQYKVLTQQEDSSQQKLNRGAENASSKTHSDGRQAEKDAQHHLSVGITNSQSEVPLRSRQTGFDTNTPSTSKNVKE